MKTKESRLLPLDALRGLIMILMALDHASFFIAHKHPFEFWGLALPQYQDALAFWTRFVTHLCAPGFFFLTGISMTLLAVSRRSLGWTEGRIVRYFVIRGFLLILINQFIENPAWALGFNAAKEIGLKSPGGGKMIMLAFGVLFGLGGVMIVGALLWRVSSTVLIGVSLAAVLISQAWTPDPSKVSVLYSPLTRLLLIPGQTNILLVTYPLVPWFGLTGLGLVFGRWLLQSEAQAYRRATILGVSFILLFLVVRWIGGFGNIHPPEGPGWIAFLNLTKYPPSLAFLLLMLGADLLLLGLFARLGEGLARGGKPLLVYGRTALFFYIAHLYLYGLMGLIFVPKGGTGIPRMYPFWILGLLLLYPLCQWYAHFKRRKTPDSIWRFF